jgi:ornithine carbamoyltransferase
VEQVGDMMGKSLLALRDLSDESLLSLLQLAADLKKKKESGLTGELLKQKNVALIFEKSSTRTRCAVTVAAVDEGGSAEYLDTHVIHLGKKESIADTARVLGGMFDGIMFRGYKQQTVELLAKYSGVPVWNGLTDQWHPTQTLADLMTVQQNFGELAGLKLVYVGDGRNNVVNSLMIGCAKVGMNFVNCTPAELAPEPSLVSDAAELAEKKGGSVLISHDPGSAVEGANVVYTDVWVSMGEEDKFDERVSMLSPFQVNMALMAGTGNIDSGEVIFLHCLPAFHDNYTECTKECGALEVTDDVFEAGFSKVFDQAANRMHTIKAIMVASIGR